MDNVFQSYCVNYMDISEKEKYLVSFKVLCIELQMNHCLLKYYAHVWNLRKVNS